MAMPRDNKENIISNSTSTDILNLVDGFIDQISKIRTVLKGVSISALILAPIAIALSIFLLTHSSFFTILENEDEFGLVLLILLGSVIAIASVWIVAGLRQYRMISTWNKRYNDYIVNKEEIPKINFRLQNSRMHSLI